jgi:hypothetical protein
MYAGWQNLGTREAEVKAERRCDILSSALARLSWAGTTQRGSGAPAKRRKVSSLCILTTQFMAGDGRFTPRPTQAVTCAVTYTATTWAAQLS